MMWICYLALRMKNDFTRGLHGMSSSNKFVFTINKDNIMLDEVFERRSFLVKEGTKIYISALKSEITWGFHSHL